MEILVDLNQAMAHGRRYQAVARSSGRAKVAEELRELGVFWLEEPLPGGDICGLADLRAESGMRIAGGEMARTPGRAARRISRRMRWTSTSRMSCWPSGCGGRA